MLEFDPYNGDLGSKYQIESHVSHKFIPNHLKTRGVLINANLENRHPYIDFLYFKESHPDLKFLKISLSNSLTLEHDD